MKKIFSLFAAVIMAVSAFAAAGDEIKAVSDIVSGKSYYLKGIYTASKVDYTVYFGPTESDESDKDVKVQSSPVSDILNAMPITFTQVTDGWTLTTPNGMYLRPHTSNGQSYFCVSEVVLTLSAGSTKEGSSKGILIGGYTVNSTEWKFQMNKTNNKMGGYSSAQYAVTLIEVDETKTTTSLEFGEYEHSININESFTEPTLTADPTSILASVTYSGNNDAVASVNATTGKLTFTGADGEIKVTASYAGDATYKASAASYTLTVVDPSKQIAIFALEANPYEWEATSNNETFFDGATYDPATEGLITLTEEGKVRMWLSSSKHSLRLYDKDADYAVGAITLTAAGAKITSIKLEGSNMTFTSTVGDIAMASDKSYSIWTGEATAVKLTKGSNTPQIKTITVTYIPKKYTVNFSNSWASFCAAEKVAIPEAVVAYKGAVNGEVLTLTPVEGNVIPANVGVMLKSTEASATLTVSEETAADFAGNELLGTTEVTAAPANAYCYSKSQNAFAPVAVDFSIPANKAYLVLASAPERISIVEADHNFVTELVNVESKVEVKKMVVNGKMMILRDGKTFDVMGRIVK